MWQADILVSRRFGLAVLLLYQAVQHRHQTRQAEDTEQVQGL